MWLKNDLKQAKSLVVFYGHSVTFVRLTDDHILSDFRYFGFCWGSETVHVSREVSMICFRSFTAAVELQGEVHFQLNCCFYFIDPVLILSMFSQ